MAVRSEIKNYARPAGNVTVSLRDSLENALAIIFARYDRDDRATLGVIPPRVVETISPEWKRQAISVTGFRVVCHAVSRPSVMIITATNETQVVPAPKKLEGPVFIPARLRS